MNDTSERFDQQIIKDAQASLDKLIAEHGSELRGVAIVFDWDLPEQAKRAFPSGLWRPNDSRITPLAAHNMSMQILGMLQFVMETSLHITNKVVGSLVAKTEEARSTDDEAQSEEPSAAS